MEVLGKQIYRFEGVEVDPSQGCLRRDGEELSVRQRSFRALVYLIEQRHRLITKEDLIDHVWKGQAVTDDALVQLIKELRRSLGDDPRQPRFIKTVPRAGYRFIAPVQEYYFDLPQAVEMEQHTSLEIEFEEEITESQDSFMTPQREARLRSAAGWRFGIAVAAISVVLIGCSLALYLAIRPRPSETYLADVTLPQVPGKRTLAVLYFDNQSASPDLDWLREGLADMLITGLSRSSELTVLSRRHLQSLLERIEHKPSETTSLEEAIRVGRQSRAEVIILGSFARLDGRIRIEAQLQDARTGQSIATERLVVDRPGDLLTQVDLLSLKIASRLGAAADDQQMQKGLAEVMTDNLQAYRCYSLAMGKAWALESREALALLEKAIALDPQFAMAHARVGYVYVTWGHPEKAMPHLEKAFQLSDRLTEKDRLSITAWYGMANLDYPGAIATFRKIIAHYPLETEAYWRLTHLLQGEDRAEEAVEVARQGLIIDPEAKDLYNILGGVYANLGRHEESIRMRQRYVELAPAEPNSHDSLGMSYQWAGQYEQAIRAYRQALELKPDFEIAVIHLANVYFQMGRYNEAINNFQRYIEVAPSDSERLRGQGSIAYVHLKKGAFSEAELVVRKAAKNSHAAMWISLLFALEHGDLPEAEKLNAQFFSQFYRNSDRGARSALRVFHRLRGELALKSGRDAEAIEAFKEALRHRPPIWDIDAAEDSLANGYLALGRLDEAIAEYDRILRLNPNYPLAHYRLAQAYERQGQYQRARESYETFLRIWEHADRDIPEVITARQRIAGE